MVYNNGFFSTGTPNGAETLRNSQNDRRSLHRLGNLAGMGLVLFVVFQFIALIILTVTGLEDEYIYDTDMTYSIGAIVSVFSIFVPFLIVWLCMKDKKKICLNFGKPYDTGLMLLAVPIGLMLCMIGNFATYYISEFFENAFGVVFESPEMATPTSPLGIAAFILQVAFVPALVEEFAVRGVIMMPLRQYGNLFAVTVSSLIFGIMHGNLVQAPFAFIVGMGIGYFVIITGSMWTGVMIHFCNNLFSCIINILYEFISEEQVDTVYYACVAAFFITGILCTFLFIRRAGNRHISIRFGKPRTSLSAGRRLVAYGLNIPMILAIIYLIYATSQYVSRV